MGLLKDLIDPISMRDLLRHGTPAGSPAIVWDPVKEDFIIGFPSGPGLDVGISTVLYVDGAGGDDATAVRGSISLKYKTIGAALANAQSGDVVFVGAGVYTENVTLPALNNCAIIGEGPGSTFLFPAANNVPTISYSGVSTIRGITIQDMSIYGGTTSEAINIDGNPSAGRSFPSSAPLLLVNLILYTQGAFSYLCQIQLVNNVLLDNVHGADSSKRILTYQVSSIGLRDTGTCAVDLAYDLAVPQPIEGIGLYQTYSCAFSEITFTNNARVICDKATSTSLLTGTIVDNATPANNGKIRFHGICFGDVNIGFICTNADQSEMIDLSQSDLEGNVTIQDTGTSTNRCVSNLRQVMCKVGTTVTSGKFSDLDMSGATYDLLAAAAAPNGGTIERDDIDGAVDFSSGNPQSPVFAVPRTSANYSVVFELPAGGAGAHPVLVSNKAATGFTATPAAAGAAGSRWHILAYAN